MPPRAAIAKLSDRDQKEVIKMIASGAPYVNICERIGCSKTALSMYVKRNLLPVACKELVRREVSGANGILNRAEDTMDKVQKMANALDRWLADPDNEGEYTMDPRHDELSVIVQLEREDSRGNIQTRRQRIPLSDLFTAYDGYDFGDGWTMRPEKFVWKNADPRKLMLETANTMKGLLELLGKITGQVKEVVDVKVDIRDQVSAIVRVISTELADEPEMRTRIVEAIEHESATAAQ